MNHTGTDRGFKKCKYVKENNTYLLKTQKSHTLCKPGTWRADE